MTDQAKQANQQNPLTQRTMVFEAPGADSVTVRRDLAYRPGDPGLTMDLYYPANAESGAPLPAVVIVAGYPDPGFAERMGCRFKDMGSTVSWARSMAATGMVVVAYANREPAGDLDALLAHLRENAAALGIDPKRLGVWAASGNAALAMSLLMADAAVPLTCAVLCYGITLDLDGATFVADGARTWGYVNPCAGRSVDDLSRATAVFLARAGQDAFAGLNDALDRFLARAVALNLPVTFANHPTGPHAFDILDDSVTTRAIIRQILTFMASHLGV